MDTDRLSCGFTSNSTQNRSFWRHFPQAILFGMTKYRKGPQRTTKEHYTGPHRIGNTAKDPQRTAKEHYGLGCRKLAPIELNGALYSSARQDFSHAAGLS